VRRWRRTVGGDHETSDGRAAAVNRYSGPDVFGTTAATVRSKRLESTGVSEFDQQLLVVAVIVIRRR
jgi:hypothetical protein